MFTKDVITNFKKKKSIKKRRKSRKFKEKKEEQIGPASVRTNPD